MGATISREELKKKIDRRENFILMETLAPAAYERAHLPGAVNVPLDRLQELAPKLAPKKDAEIVVYCASPDMTRLRSRRQGFGGNGIHKRERL